MSHAHDVMLDEAHSTVPAGSVWRKLALPLFGGGLVLIVIALAVGLSGGDELKYRFFHSYLTAYMYVLSIALGAQFFVMVQFITRAGWSVGIRRVAENLMATLPALAVLAIPMLLGVDQLYHHWTHVAPDDALVQAKEAYLNKPFFFVRAIVVLGCWAVLALIFYRNSVRQDTTRAHDITRRLQMYAAPGIAFFAITVTIAAIDWLMSLNPHWFSTIWGIYYFAGSMVAVFATLSLLALGLKKSGMLGPAVSVEHRHDLGKFLFGFVVFWAYISFSQYMLIWYPNMPEETMFYADRFYMIDEVNHVRVPTSWLTVSLVLAVGHFLVPFFFLMSRHIKRRNLTLAIGAIWLLMMHYLDLYWVVMPNLYPKGVEGSLVWMDLITLAGALMVLFGAFGWLLGRSRVVPVGDPRLPETLKFENF